MKNKDEFITGVIPTDTVSYAFYLKDYTLIVLDNVVSSNRCSTVTSTDGFMQVVSHNKSKMLLHIGNNDLSIVNLLKIHLNSYIVSATNVDDCDLSYFDGIEFVGGTLANLKRPMGMSIKYDSEGRRYIEHNSDEQCFSFEAGDCQCNVTIGSITNEHHGLTECSITNSSIYFQMVFDKKQKTSEFYNHNNKVRQLLSFLTNRQNVGFEKIRLLQKCSDGTTLRTSAEVYIRQEKEFTQKPVYYNLSFDMLEGSLDALMKIFYSTTERKKSYSLGFHYEDDSSAGLMGNETVRQVCSALECELGFVPKISSDESRKIKALSKQLKEIINEHKRGEDRLLDKTYSLIEGSMMHWSMSASDQIKALLRLFEQEMRAITKSGKQCNDEDIDNFVKYRNDITHGSYRVINQEIAYTTYLLACLVYCCILTRIGIPRETLLKWCDKKRLMN